MKVTIVFPAWIYKRETIYAQFGGMPMLECTTILSWITIVHSPKG